MISHIPGRRKISLWRIGAKARRELGNWKFELGQSSRPHQCCLCSRILFVCCVYILCEGKWTIFSNTSLMVSCSQQCPTELPADRCNNYGNSVQSASSSMQYVGLDFAPSMICFLLLFAFLEQNHLLRCLQSSVAVMVLISHKQPWRMDLISEAVWTYFVWRHRCDDGFSGNNLVSVFFFSFQCVWAAFVCNGA